MPCPSAGSEWLMDLLSDYYASSHGLESPLLLRLLTFLWSRFLSFLPLSLQWTILFLVSSGLPLPPSHPRCEGQESSSADGPSVYHGKIAFGFRACAMPEWQICIHSTWQNLSLALSALLSTRAPWACVTLHLWDELETKAWESWEPLSLVCKHTRGLARFSAGVASVFLLDKLLCDLVKLVFRNCGVHIDREIRS